MDARHKFPGVQVQIRSPEETQELFANTVNELRPVLDSLGLLVEQN